MTGRDGVKVTDVPISKYATKQKLKKKHNRMLESRKTGLNGNLKLET